MMQAAETRVGNDAMKGVVNRWCEDAVAVV